MRIFTWKRVSIFGVCVLAATVSGCPQANMGSGATMGPEGEVTALPAVKVALPPPPSFAASDIPIKHPDGVFTLRGVRKSRTETLNKDVKVRGYLLEVYQCQTPICPKGKTCKLCDQPHFFIGDKADTKQEKGMMVVDYLLPKQRPPAMTVGKAYDIDGTFSINSPSGFGHSDGLLIFGKMTDDRGIEFLSQAAQLEKKALAGEAEEAAGGKGIPQKKLP